MEDIPLEKIGISGPALASIIQRFSCSEGDVDGLLIGHVAQPAPSNLLLDGDDDDHASNPTTTSSLVANITGYLCSGTLCSFYDPVGRIDMVSLGRSLGGDQKQLIGWFVGRRRTPLRPSMREYSVSASLSSYFQTLDLPSSSSCCCPVFLLLSSSSSSSSQSIHTHDYKAFQFRSSIGVFEPKTMDIVNIGPAFRAHYGAFAPISPFPCLSTTTHHTLYNDDDDDDTTNNNISLISLKARLAKEQPAATGGALCDVGKLTKLMGKEATDYTSHLEDIYTNMLAKLDGLARLVENTSSTLLHQEHCNIKLRNKFSGLE